MAYSESKGYDFFSIDEEYSEPSSAKLSNSGILMQYHHEVTSNHWISDSSTLPERITKQYENNIRIEWREKYTGYLTDISKHSKREDIEYVFFVKIIHDMGEDFNMGQHFILKGDTDVHKKSLINFLRHAPDLYKYLSSESIFVDNDTKCVSVQIKRNRIRMNMFFKKDGGILFNTFDDDGQDDSFRIFGDVLTSGKSYLRAAKIKRILSILGE